MTDNLDLDLNLDWMEKALVEEARSGPGVIVSSETLIGFTAEQQKRHDALERLVVKGYFRMGEPGIYRLVA